MGSSRIWVWLMVLAVGLVVPAGAHAAFPGANGKIAFVRDNDIWTMNPDGSNQVDITNTPSANEGSPAWSADGKRIAYVRRTDQPFLNSSEIWVMNADGTGQTLIVPAPTDPNMCVSGSIVVSSSLGSPHWSPDGSKLVFHHFRSCRDPDTTESPESDLYTVNADGSGRTLLKALYGAGPVWSPDGTKIGYSGDCYTGPCDNVSWITPDGSQDFVLQWVNGEAAFVDWHPWESLVQGFGERPTGFFWFTIRPDGTGYTEFPSGVIPGKWSPDGTRFLLSGVYTENVDGSDKKQIASGGAADWQPITTNYARPRGASPLQTFLVPAYAPCTAPNRTHGSPLSFPSCAPPSQTSAQLTVGTPDANGAGAKSVAKVFYAVRPGDLAVSAAISDVRNKSDLSDYTGELSLVSDLRITDRNNSPGPSGPGPGTVIDTTLPITIPCTDTSGDPTTGSECDLATTVNTLYPGAITAGQRAIWQLGQVKAYDGGPDGLASTTTGNTIFLDQGIFIP